MSGASQMQFLQRGGPMSGIMDAKIESGELNPTYTFREYPRMLYVSLGITTERKRTQVIRGKEEVIEEWDDTRERFREIIVNSEAEEEAVLAGGRSDIEVEAQRQEMISNARSRNIQVDESWGLVRLQRELGAAPTNETIDALRTKVADLEEKAALRAQIAELTAQMARLAVPTQAWRPVADASITAPTYAENERDLLRQQLMDLGVAVDMRWQVPRLRAELDAATAPDGR